MALRGKGTMRVGPGRTSREWAMAITAAGPYEAQPHAFPGSPTSTSLVHSLGTDGPRAGRTMRLDVYLLTEPAHRIFL
jgi:hypothetical protein